MRFAPAHGDPVEAILVIAAQVDADLIVLGSHERSLIERALGISVSGAVTRKHAATCSSRICLGTARARAPRVGRLRSTC